MFLINPGPWRSGVEHDPGNGVYQFEKEVEGWFGWSNLLKSIEISFER
jgi:hypothetical protein